MKVLLLGATGNLGIRLIPALLSHNLTVVAFVRSSAKLSSMLPSAILSEITIVEGDAKSSDLIKKAILDNDCDAVVNTAGLAALLPWKSSELPAIFAAVVQAAKEAGAQQKKALRVWFLAGLGLLDMPGTKSMLVDYLPVYREHRPNFVLLQTIPTDVIRWSILCPSVMNPRSSELVVPVKGTQKLIMSATVPPHWKDSWMRRIPLVGPFIVLAKNVSQYSTDLEDNAEVIANDLEHGDDEWVGKKVGVWKRA
ncbi:hypothetical protein POJ06DRAFT_247259 [Lipomyces tetrasporus]|uniref:NAD(P)-binding domain-containing protein n=1 Tax=Lipomyces tetrasporus TaxID=54092 RepID=A0AAD7VWC9_9ASCO|nr:uncharacterized protein POJ06DRAFT_247259 [Lipomyces tetrasporus]KAJ8103330.1 hypothetical protein POJ06DRAFT_247259 [Lipomyces tetrasporus]